MLIMILDKLWMLNKHTVSTFLKLKVMKNGQNVMLNGEYNLTKKIVNTLI